MREQRSNILAPKLSNSNIRSVIMEDLVSKTLPGHPPQGIQVSFKVFIHGEKKGEEEKG